MAIAKEKGLKPTGFKPFKASMRLDSKEQPHSETCIERSFGDVIYFCTHLCTRQIYIKHKNKTEISHC